MESTKVNVNQGTVFFFCCFFFHFSNFCCCCLAGVVVLMVVVWFVFNFSRLFFFVFFIFDFLSLSENLSLWHFLLQDSKTVPTTSYL